MIRCLALGLDVVLDFDFWGMQFHPITVATVGACHRRYEFTRLQAEAWRQVQARNINFDA